MKSQSITVRPLTAGDAELIYQFYTENRDFFAPWEPVRDDEYFTLDYWRQAGLQAEKAFMVGTQYRFLAVLDDEMIGFCNFSNVVHGVFQACHLGYGLAEKHNGHGYMTEILQVATNYIFEEIGLHRIMANYMPRNEASGRVLEKLGFEREGYAKQYLKIAGQWEDHILTAKINPFRD